MTRCPVAVTLASPRLQRVTDAQSSQRVTSHTEKQSKFYLVRLQRLKCQLSLLVS